jgi:hypothetical protein
MVNEVNLHRARRTGSGSVVQRAKMALNAQRGRLGMRLAQFEREAASNGSGRGWNSEERARDGW